MPQAVGRNDPCPCGSGKKYKHCHMRQDRVSQSRELSLSQEEAFLLNALFQYAQSRFSSELREAFPLYWGGVYDIEGTSQVDPDDIRRMFEWFVHDYHTSNDRRYIIDLFSESQASNYPQVAKDILAAWRESVMGLFKVLNTNPDGRLELFDSLRKAELAVQDPTLARNARPGDLLVGRLYEMDGVKRLSYMTLVLPGAFEEDMVDYITHAYNVYSSEHYKATWDEFLREYGYLFNAYLLSLRAEAFRAQIGPGTRYHDPAIARDKLREFTEQRARERLEQEREAQEQERLPGRMTPQGIIVPGVEPREPAAEKQAEPEKRSPILLPGRDF